MATKFDYTKARATAERLINKFGKAGTVYSSPETGGTDALGNALPDSVGKVINGFVTPLLPFTSKSEASLFEVNGVKAGDMFAFFHSDELIDINMLHDSNGETWRVMSVIRLTDDNGVNVFQQMMLRK